MVNKVGKSTLALCKGSTCIMSSDGYLHAIK